MTENLVSVNVSRRALRKGHVGALALARARRPLHRHAWQCA